MPLSPQTESPPKRGYGWPLVLGLLSTLILAESQSSWAKTYRYQTPDGHWTISNSPPADHPENVTEMPEGIGPSMQITAQASRLKPLKELRNQRLKETTRRQDRHRRRRQQVPSPIDTHQFGVLAIGSSKAEVVSLLGPPEKRVKQGKQKRLVKLNGYFAERKVKVETWHYPGSNRIQPTRLVFYDGQLAEKDKGEP